MRFYSILLILLFPIFHVSVLAAKGPDYTVLSSRTSITIREGKMETERSYQIQVNNKNGDKAGKIEIPFTSENKILALKAWIQDTMGKMIRELGKKEFIDISSPDERFYTDYFQRTFELRHSIYPYQICYSYTQSSPEFVLITEWTPVYESGIKTINASLVADIPLNYQIHILQKNISSPRIDTVGGRIHYQWQAHYDSIIRKEEYSLPPEEYVPRVILSPVGFFYSIKGNSQSWLSFGDYFADLTCGLYNLPEAAKNDVIHLTGKIPGNRDKILLLYHFLQDHTRYINVTINTGGLRPFPASYVCEKRYGDCKALCIYMQALLAAAGIPSNYALIRSGENPAMIDKNTPWQQFDHVVVFVPLEKDTLWLECTSNIDPFAYVGTFIQDRDALIIEKGNSHFVKTPSLEQDAVREIRTFHFDTDSAGNCIVQMTAKLRGGAFEVTKAIQSELDENTKEHFFQEVLAFRDYQVRKYSIAQENRDRPEITMTMEFTLPHYYSIYRGERVADLPPSGIPDFERPSRRQLPVNMPFPVYKEDSMYFKIPEGCDPFIPQDLEYDQKFGMIKIMSKKQGNYVLVHRIVLIRKGYYPLTSYGDFYSFILKIREFDKKHRNIFKNTL